MSKQALSLGLGNVRKFEWWLMLTVEHDKPKSLGKDGLALEHFRQYRKASREMAVGI